VFEKPWCRFILLLVLVLFLENSRKTEDEEEEEHEREALNRVFKRALTEINVFRIWVWIATWL
jgi:hypothetical protein